MTLRQQMISELSKLSAADFLSTYLLIAFHTYLAHLNGIQNNKKKLEEYYQQYDKSFDEADSVRSLFVTVLGEVHQLLPDISKTRWRKKSDFYSLFLAFGRGSKELPLSAEQRISARNVLLEFGTLADAVIREGVPPGTTVPKSVSDY